MSRFSSNDAEKIVYIHCFFDCIESKYFLGMLRFHTMLSEWGITKLTEDQLREIHENANMEYEDEYHKLVIAVDLFTNLRKSPLFKNAVMNELSSALDKYAKLLDQDSHLECEDSVCTLPEENLIEFQTKEQEIYSAVKFLRKGLSAEVQEKLILLGLH